MMVKYPYHHLKPYELCLSINKAFDRTHDLIN